MYGYTQNSSEKIFKCCFSSINLKTNERQLMTNIPQTISQITSDRLAYEVARLVQNNRIGTRSSAADALLDYLQIGSGSEFSSIPEWLEDYERKQMKGN